jgi:flagellar biosynthesis/type III secretory pathway protein FliH
MAEKKITRHNHPLIVNARKESYWAGRSDGYYEGYQQGCEHRCTEVHRYYRTIISALETKLDVANERIKMLEEGRMSDG